MLHAAVLRSPHAHARLGAIRTKAALALPGVVRWSPPTTSATSAGSPCGSASPGRACVACLQPPLARDMVRYVGEPVAVVVAESRYLAEDALELVEVDYDPLPTVADARRAARARRARAPRGDRAATSWTRSRPRRATRPRRSRARAYRVRERFGVQRHTGVPMETRGLTAAYDPGTGVLRSGAWPRCRTSTGACWPICSAIPST